MKINLDILNGDTRYEVIPTIKLKKDLKKIYKQNKDLNKLAHVIEKLANKENLPIKNKDHLLTNFENCRECHIEPDWLLVYRINNNQLILLLVETGTHSDLFS